MNFMRDLNTEDFRLHGDLAPKGKTGKIVIFDFEELKD